MSEPVSFPLPISTGKIYQLDKEQFTPGQTVYYVKDMSPLPNQPAEPLPQKCPFCGSESDVSKYGYVDFRVCCSLNEPCLLGPHKPTRLEAIQAWNLIQLVSLQNPRRTTVEWVEKIDAEFPDAAPLTEEWLRKVGLCDWTNGLRGPFQFEVPAQGGCIVHYKLSPTDNVYVSAEYLCLRTTCKTIGDARALCRLLDVPIKE